MPEVNFLAVLLAGVAAMVLGGLWYSPVLFGKQWMTASGMTEAKMKGMKMKPAMAYVLGLVAALVKAYVLALFLGMASDASMSQALMISFWAWLGFAATIDIGAVLWEGKPFSLFVLNTAYNLVSFLIMGAVITAL